MNILWDFDGTLFNTYPSYTKLLKEMLGDSATEEEALAQLKVSFGHAFRFFKMTEEQSRKMMQKVRGLKAEEFEPFPGVEEVLKLAEKNVIMTHKEREDVWKVLQIHGLDQYFADIIAGDDGYPRKPDTSAYLHLHRKHRIDLVIGDRDLDLQPARELGIGTCAFQNHEAEANFYLDDYRDFDRIWKIFKEAEK